MLSLGSEKIGGATTSSPITTADPSPPALWRTTRPQKRGRDREVAYIGYREVAEALERFAEIYGRVEEAKHRRMVELEK
ncbi:hypothetical protein ACSQ67_007183 [Phaseolus vulgaris]